MTIATECLTFAYYGLPNHPTSVLHFSEFIEWLSQVLQLDRNVIMCSIQHDDVQLRSGSFDQAAQAIVKHAGSEITSIQVTLRESKDSSNQTPFLLSSGLSIASSYAIIAISVSLFPSGAFQQFLVQKPCEMLSPVYGIGYLAPATNDALYYALGIVSTSSIPVTEEEWDQMERISRWGHTGMPNQVYRTGMLRDVYSWNILSATHCGRLIGGIPLSTWIAKRSSHGSLMSLTSELSLWTIPQENLSAIRKTLTQAGILFV